MKAYILRIENEISKEYANFAAQSCLDNNIEPIFFKGFQNMPARAALRMSGLEAFEGLPDSDFLHLDNPSQMDKAFCCTAGHLAIWKYIAEGEDDAAIVLEHDAIMLSPLTFEIPDGKIVVLGYKVKEPDRYSHKEALLKHRHELIDIDGHEGAHAYAMTKKTAQYLVNEIKSKGLRGAIDNEYFIRGQRRTAVPLVIASPTPALGWIRESTIWHQGAFRNYDFIPSFHEFYK